MTKAKGKGKKEKAKSQKGITSGQDLPMARVKGPKTRTAPVEISSLPTPESQIQAAQPPAQRKEKAPG